MRRIWGLWPIVPAVAEILLLATPETIGPLARPVIVSLIAVGLEGAVTRAYVRSRIEPLVAIAERLAAGETGVSIPARWDSLGQRLATAITTLGSSMAAAQSDATTDRLTGLTNRPAIIG